MVAGAISTSRDRRGQQNGGIIADSLSSSKRGGRIFGHPAVAPRTISYGYVLL